MNDKDEAKPAARAGNDKTVRELARETGLPLLDADHPLQKSGYVIGGRRLKDVTPSPQKPAPESQAPPGDASSKV